MILTLVQKTGFGFLMLSQVAGHTVAQLLQTAFGPQSLIGSTGLLVVPMET